MVPAHLQWHAQNFYQNRVDKNKIKMLDSKGVIYKGREII